LTSINKKLNTFSLVEKKKQIKKKIINKEIKKLIVNINCI